ncbi:MAG: RNA polymerase sigma factor [Burkholderiaceae bacterium]|nr:RNA polymerase sigma factor [Burkholderiaceae bacterium]
MQPAVAPLDIGQMSDADIARRVADGDRAVFTALMKRHNQSLYRAARSILKDEAEAEDAVQEAYLHAYRAIAGFRGDARLSTWLVSIAVNQALGRRRQRTRRAEVVWLGTDAALDPELEMTIDPSQEDPERAAWRAQIRAMIEAGIDRLPEAFRTVFVLRGVEELTVEETAVALGIPAATVRTRFFRARALLRESLAREVDSGIDNAFGFAGERCDRIVARVLASLPPP